MRLSLLLSVIAAPLSTSSFSSEGDLDNTSLRRAVQDYLDDPESTTARLGPIQEWNTWKVTDTSHLFQGATSPLLVDLDLSNWDMSSVTSLSHMFAGATNYTGTGLEQWDVSKVVDFSYLFAQAEQLEGVSVSDWNTEEAITMEGMFRDATQFNAPLDKWSVERVTSLDSMFRGAKAFNQPLNTWNVANAKYINSLWEGATSFGQDDICWDLNAQARCFQCFCGTNRAGFQENSSQCKSRIHPSVVAYSQACNANDDGNAVLYVRPVLKPHEEESVLNQLDTGITDDDDFDMDNSTKTGSVATITAVADRSDSAGDSSYGFQTPVDIDVPVFDDGDRNDGTGLGIIEAYSDAGGTLTMAGIQQQESGTIHTGMGASLLLVWGTTLLATALFTLC